MVLPIAEDRRREVYWLVVTYAACSRIVLTQISTTIFRKSEILSMRLILAVDCAVFLYTSSGIPD